MPKPLTPQQEAALAALEKNPKIFLQIPSQTLAALYVRDLIHFTYTPRISVMLTPWGRQVLEWSMNGNFTETYKGSLTKASLSKRRKNI